MRGDTATIRSRPCNGRVNVQSRFVIPQVEEEKETESAKCKIPRPPSASNRRGVPRSTPVERIESRVRMQDEAAAFRQFKDLLKAEHGKENVNPRAGQFVRSTSAAACLSRPPTVPKSNATDASEACWQEEESAGAKAPRISCLRRGSSSSNVSDISEDALRIASCKMSPREPSLDKELSVAGKVPRRRPLLRERPQSAQKLKARPASGRRSAMEHGTDNSSRKS